MVAYSLYLHIPFCQKRCYYCDFNTYAGMERWMPAYTSALCAEITQVAQLAGEELPVHTLFFGGGTPSLLSIPQLGNILATIDQNFALQPGLEATLEANPGTVALEYLQSLRKLGINRLSLGMQSANPEELTLLGRIHDTPEVIQAVKWARQAGFNNLNLDLIFGLPFQTLEMWQRSLELALKMKPEHLSLYALTVEQGTPFYRWSQRGLIPLPDDDLAADQYEWAEERLEKEGFHHYEISNWARNDGHGNLLACRHNLQYWRTQPYLGFGAGAHGFAGGVRTENVPGIQAYILGCQNGKNGPFPSGPATVKQTPIEARTEMMETMMVGLRLVEEGIDGKGFEERFKVPLDEAFGEQIKKLSRQGLLETVDGRVRLTRRGRLLGNRVFMEFV
jgi:oxygen-independent coproporphyrinogen-3 oxidase